MADQPSGTWGNTEYGYDFIPDGKSTKRALRPLTKTEFLEMSSMFLPPAFETIKGYIGRLALRKRIGSMTEATAPMLFHDLAADLQEYSELAILMAFRDVRREPGDWLSVGNLCQRVKEWQGFVDDLSHKTHAPGLAKPAPKKAERYEELAPATDADKAQVAKYVAEALKNLQSGGAAV